MKSLLFWFLTLCLAADAQTLHLRGVDIRSDAPPKADVWGPSLRLQGWRSGAHKPDWTRWVHSEGGRQLLAAPDGEWFLVAENLPFGATLSKLNLQGQRIDEWEISSWKRPRTVRSIWWRGERLILQLGDESYGLDQAARTLVPLSPSEQLEEMDRPEADALSLVQAALKRGTSLSPNLEKRTDLPAVWRLGLQARRDPAALSALEKQARTGEMNRHAFEALALAGPEPLGRQLLLWSKNIPADQNPHEAAAVFHLLHDSELSWQCVLASHGKVLDYLDRDFADSLWSRLVALAQGDDPELARQALSYLGNNGDEGKRKQRLALLLAEPLPSYKDVLSYFHFYRYSPALPAMISLLQKGIPERSGLYDALENQTGMGLGLDPQAWKDWAVRFQGGSKHLPADGHPASLHYLARYAQLQSADLAATPRLLARLRLPYPTRLASDGQSLEAPAWLDPWLNRGGRRPGFRLNGEGSSLSANPSLHVRAEHPIFLIEDLWEVGGGWMDGRSLDALPPPETSGLVTYDEQQRAFLRVDGQKVKAPGPILALHPRLPQLVCRADGSVGLWDWELRRFLWKKPAAGGEHFVFSADGDRLLRSSENSWHLVGPEGQPLGQLHQAPHQERLARFRLSGDGRWVLGGYQDGVGLWEAETGQLRGVDRSGAYPLCFSEDSGLAVLRNGNRVFRLLKVPDLQPLPLLVNSTEGLQMPAIVSRSRDGRRLAVSDSSGRVSVWDLFPTVPKLLQGDPEKIARQWTGTWLVDEELQTLPMANP